MVLGRFVLQWRLVLNAKEFGLSFRLLAVLRQSGWRGDRLVKRLFWILFAILLLLHHDFWWWDDPTIVLGFMPIGLAYHVGFSLLAAAFWWAVVTFSWPSNVDS